MMKRRGFTIVELMMVVGILAVLLTIVITAATGAIKQARINRADALVRTVQAGIMTYYAQYNQWPGGFDPENVQQGGNVIGANNQTDPDRYQLTTSETDDCIRDVVRKSVDGNTSPLLDVMSLFVARAGSIGDKTTGMDMHTAIHGSKSSPKKLNRINEMVFGYPEPEHGYFRRFKLIYSVPTDHMSVTK